MEVGGGDGDGEGDGGDLSQGVDAGVGAARALRENGFAGDAVDGLRQGALNGREIGLNLPSVVGGSVVGEDEFPVRHGTDLDGITGTASCGFAGMILIEDRQRQPQVLRLRSG